MLPLRKRYAVFLLLKFTSWCSKAYFAHLLHNNPTASDGIQNRTRGIETEISMEVRILHWFWCWYILGNENIYIYIYFFFFHKNKVLLSEGGCCQLESSIRNHWTLVANMQNCCCHRREQWLRTKGFVNRFCPCQGKDGGPFRVLHDLTKPICSSPSKIAIFFRLFSLVKSRVALCMYEVDQS